MLKYTIVQNFSKIFDTPQAEVYTGKTGCSGRQDREKAGEKQKPNYLFH
jgi:hypothetical protein